MEMRGAAKLGSAKAPTATLTRDCSQPASVWNTVVPHTGQNRKVNCAPPSPVRTYSVAVPEIVYGALKPASAANTLPVRRWQARQWQTPTPRGSPCTSMRSWPQEHEAVRDGMMTSRGQGTEAGCRGNPMRQSAGIVPGSRPLLPQPRRLRLSHVPHPQRRAQEYRRHQGQQEKRVIPEWKRMPEPVVRGDKEQQHDGRDDPDRPAARSGAEIG